MRKAGSTVQLLESVSSLMMVKTAVIHTAAGEIK